MERREMTAYVLLLLAGICWGTSGIFVNLLGSYGLSSSAISCCRVMPAFLFLFGAAVIVCGRDLFRIDRRSLLYCLLLGIICQCMFNMCYTSAIRSIGMSFSAVILYLAPALTALESAFFFREKITSGKTLALSVTILGCALTVTGGHPGEGVLPAAGILAGLGAAVCYSLAAVFGRAASGNVNPLVSTTWTFFFASAFMMVSVHPVQELRALPPAGWLVVFGYAAIPTAAAYLLYFSGVKRVKEVGIVPVITAVEPVTAALLGAMVFQEELHAANTAGIGLVILSMFLIHILPSKKIGLRIHALKRVRPYSVK